MYQADAMLYPLLLTQLSDRLLLTTTSAFRTSSVLPAQTGITRSTPVDLLQLGHISENLEEWAVAAFDSYPKDFADCRIELASRAAHLLGRLAGVLQLVRAFLHLTTEACEYPLTIVGLLRQQAQALSRTLAAPTTIDTMLTAWYKLDFETITNQCALVTGCAQDSIQSYFDAFKELLQGVRQHSAARASSGLSLEQNHCITTLLEYSNTALERYINTLAEHSARLSGYREDKKGSNAGDVFAAAEMKMDERPFLIKWSYVSGQILRDLIISSSAAFGPFQILALFVE